MVHYISLVGICPLLCESSTFTHPNPHTVSQVTLSQPQLLTLSFVYVLHPILPCLKIGKANDITIPHSYLLPAPAPLLCIFAPATWKSTPQNFRDILYLFLYQVLPTQPRATNTGYTKSCFHNEPIKFIIISYKKTTTRPYHKKQVLSSFFPFNFIANTVSDNSNNTHYIEIFNNMVSAHYTFISLLIYTTIPTIFSPSLNIRQIQIIHRTPNIIEFRRVSICST